MGTAIKVEDLSKAYQLGEIGTGTLSNDLKRWAYKVRGKEDPFLKIGETNDRTIKGESDTVWSLKNLDFEIEQGDAVGIIGRNGAGKSTLLKILSRVTSPTTGSVKVKGRVASLLEVGTGFHPELTGKENIFLNGAILGMRKAEIKKHFDAIVDFAGVERYIDTPVKRYSSGMYVRLAFAVAAHLESEILVVDEVLAVGDAEFQKKCLGKMNDVNKGEGRTVLFVSHNIGSITRLCKKGILLDNGNLVYSGLIEPTINKYLREGNECAEYYKVEDIKRDTQILSVKLVNQQGESVSEFRYDEPINIILKIKNKSSKSGIRCNIGLLDNLEQVIFVERIELKERSGIQSYKIILEKKQFIPNTFRLSVSVDIPSVELLDMMDPFISLNIVDTGSKTSKNNDTVNGLIVPRLEVYEI
jgi:lipopolysaccharide transport system ATP-binding protein